MKPVYIYEFLIESINKYGIAETEKIVYGHEKNKIIGMVKFINSRQRWCKRDILKQLKED